MAFYSQPVGADNVTLEVSNGLMQIKDSGVGTDELAAESVTVPKLGDGLFTELMGAVKNVAVADVWEDWDLSGTLPATARVAFILFHAQSAARVMGLRKNGSALERSWTVGADSTMIAMVDVSASRTVEIRGSHTASADFYPVGYI